MIGLLSIVLGVLFLVVAKAEKYFSLKYPCAPEGMCSCPACGYWCDPEFNQCPECGKEIAGAGREMYFLRAFKWTFLERKNSLALSVALIALGIMWLLMPKIITGTQMSRYGYFENPIFVTQHSETILVAGGFWQINSINPKSTLEYFDGQEKQEIDLSHLLSRGLTRAEGIDRLSSMLPSDLLSLGGEVVSNESREKNISNLYDKTSATWSTGLDSASYPFTFGTYQLVRSYSYEEHYESLRDSLFFVFPFSLFLMMRYLQREKTMSGDPKAK